MIRVYCGMQRLPTCRMYKVERAPRGCSVGALQFELVGCLLEGGCVEPQCCPSMYKPIINGSDMLYAMVFKPHNFLPGVGCPTVLNVYGGPEVQTVGSTFKVMFFWGGLIFFCVDIFYFGGMRQLGMHMLAAQGCCVVCMDSGGSRHGGVRFEWDRWNFVIG